MVEHLAQKRVQKFGTVVFGANARQVGNDVVPDQSEMEISPRGDHDLVRQVALYVALQPLQELIVVTDVDRILYDLEVASKVSGRQS